MTCRHCQHNPAKVIDHQRIEEEIIGGNSVYWGFLFQHPDNPGLGIASITSPGILKNMEFPVTFQPYLAQFFCEIFSRNPGQQEDILDFSFSINTDIMIITRLAGDPCSPNLMGLCSS
ncbi:hypothetical protein I79_020132 [Cricetulus griseus]|uniref:Uncharacterized protein n=1 Tax=Cricetulus griseus TaxID=10029 RepID=G3I996_CRIGR|nr:hypothetical protein I79_020132 [Cricetulus griseus]